MRTVWEGLCREKLITKSGNDYSFDDEDAFDLDEVEATLVALNW